MEALIVCLRDCAGVIRDRQINDNGIQQNVYTKEKRNEILQIDLNQNPNDYDKTLGFEWCGNDTHIVITGDLIDPTKLGNYIYTENDPNYNPNSGRQEILRNHVHRGSCVYDNDNFHPQIEIKIIKFLNYLHDQANITNGKVIKLLGNHEILNFIEPSKQYLFRVDNINDRNGLQYYNNLSRENYFKIKESFSYTRKKNGFDLFLKGGGTGVCVVINNNIYVHGGIVTDFNIDHFIEFNNLLNSLPALIAEHKRLKRTLVQRPRIQSREDEKAYEIVNQIGTEIAQKRAHKIAQQKAKQYLDDQLLDIINKIHDYALDIVHHPNKTPYIEMKSITWTREYGKNNITSSQNNINEIKRRLNNFMHTTDMDYRLLIGHCRQNDEQLFKPDAITTNLDVRPYPQYTTFDYVNNNNSSSIIDVYDNSNIRHLVNTTPYYQFGIVTNCFIGNNPLIIKLDVGMSRSQKQYFANSQLEKNNSGGLVIPEQLVKMFVLVSTPQVFSIEKNQSHQHDVLKIIKSKFKNTRENVPTSVLKGTIDDRSTIYKCLDIAPSKSRLPNGDPDPRYPTEYYNKYLKYKNKYLKLKQNLVL
jgi:hypothetical protein